MRTDGRTLSDTGHLLVEWLKRDFRVRYTQTLLGSLWAFAQPVALTAAFVFIFGRIARIEVDIPYASFVFPAMLLWTLFAAGVTNASLAMVNSMYVAAKASYPRIVAPISATLMPLIDFAAGLVMLPVLLLVQDAPGRFEPVPFVLAFAGTLLLAIGVGTLLSALTIFVRDIKNVLPLALQLALLLTPVAYPTERIPAVLAVNPMATFVQGMRAAVLDVPGPATAEWLIALLVSATLSVAGVWYFQRVHARFPDVA